MEGGEDHFIDKGQDGQCRVAKIKVGDTELTRSIGHLYPLEVEDHNGNRQEQNNLDPVIPLPLCPMDTDQVLNDVVSQPMTIDIDQQPSPECPTQQLDCAIDPAIELATDLADHLMSESRDDFVTNQADKEVLDVIENPVVDPAVENVTDPTVRDASNLTDDNALSTRPMRQAAIRAREKIAEWTHNLVVLLQ